MKYKKFLRAIPKRLYRFVFITSDKPYEPYSVFIDKCAYISTMVLLIAVILLSAIYHMTGFSILGLIPPCMLHMATGLYCPGCGGTRAILSLLRGDLTASFLYHPFIIYTVVPGMWLMISHTVYHIQISRISGKSNNSINNNTSFHLVRPLTLWPAYFYMGIALIIIQCILKNLIQLYYELS